MAKKKRTWKQWLLTFVLVAMAVAAAVPLVVTWIERRQDAAVRELEPHVAAGDGGAIVIYFSRSGNTALAARHIANRLDARLVEIVAPDYELGVDGWANAMTDARGRDADISPRTVDLTRYDPIYLGSPIWLYSPAPPIWKFMESNRFDGKRVVLFNTLNSEFGPERIDEFDAGVIERGARAFEHRWIRRGRMTQQLSPQEMLDHIDAEWLDDDAPSD